MSLIECPGCSKDVSSEATACPGCGQPIDVFVKCPRCKSRNVKIITGASKGLSILMLGPFAANTVLNGYICSEWSCRHKFSHGGGTVFRKPTLAERIATQAAAMREQHPEITPEQEEHMHNVALAGAITGLTVMAGLIFFLF